MKTFEVTFKKGYSTDPTEVLLIYADSFTVQYSDGAKFWVGFWPFRTLVAAVDNFLSINDISTFVGQDDGTYLEDDGQGDTA